MTIKFRCGADPEVFLLKNKKLISCVGLVQGTKDNPTQIPFLPNGFTVQQDNVALEFGIPPAASKEEFVAYIHQVQQAGKKILGLSFSPSSCEVFPEDQMQTAEAHTFGCEPDYNAWTGEINPTPQPPHPFMRSAGGHVHVETKLSPNEVGKAMDLFLGLPSLFLDKKGSARRAFYGKAGAIRYKPYGLEYRTLSNFWIMKPKLISMVWDNTARALEFVSTKKQFNDTRVAQAINNSDTKLAHQLMQEYGV